MNVAWMAPLTSIDPSDKDPSDKEGFLLGHLTIMAWSNIPAADSSQPTLNFSPSYPLYGNAEPECEFEIVPFKYRPKKAPTSKKLGRRSDLPNDVQAALDQALREQHRDGDESMDSILSTFEITHGTRVSTGTAVRRKRALGIRKNNADYAQPAWPEHPSSASNVGRVRYARRLPSRSCHVGATCDCGRMAPGFALSVHSEIANMLNLMGGCVKRHLDISTGIWSWTNLSLAFAPTAMNTSELWRAISDHCHGVSALIQRNKMRKAEETVRQIFSKLEIVAKQRDPWILVYFWKILLYVRGITFRLPGQSDSFWKQFLFGFCSVYQCSSKETSPLIGLLVQLYFVPVEVLKPVIRVLYLHTIHEMERYEFLQCHPITLGMHANFHAYFDTKFSAEKFEVYKALGQDILRGSSFSNEHALVASDFLTATVREDRSLAGYVAHRLITLTSNEPLTTWNLFTRAHVKAAKYLIRSLWRDDQDYERSLAISRSIAICLSRGDRECRTRALQIQIIVEQRCESSNVPNPESYTDRGVTTATIAASIGDIPESSAKWNGKRPRVQNIRLTKEHSEKMKQESKRRRKEQGQQYLDEINKWRTDKEMKRAERVRRCQEKVAKEHNVSTLTEVQKIWQERKTKKMQRLEANSRRATETAPEAGNGSSGGDDA